MNLTLKIWRQKGANAKGKIVDYKVSDIGPDMSFLEMMDAPKEAVVDQRTKQKICCAVTMAGKPCRFKAVVGDYCRKHKVSDIGMGKKVDVNSLLSQLDGIKITG